MFQGKAAARLDESGVALRQGYGQSRRNERPATARLEHDVFARQEIQTGVALLGVGGQGKIRIESSDLYVEHLPRVLNGRSDEHRYPDAMLAWMDLEMTGLDPDTHTIIEIATIITDDELETVAEGPDLVIHQSPAAMADMDDFVRDMHERSGLLAEIDRSTISLEAAGEQTFAFLREHISEPGTVPLCGNSIGTDRRFLAKHLPTIESYLHYRSVDVSTLKELARRWQPDVLAGAPKKEGGHRLSTTFARASRSSGGTDA